MRNRKRERQKNRNRKIYKKIKTEEPVKEQKQKYVGRETEIKRHNKRKRKSNIWRKEPDGVKERSRE
jgi:hypothetical protein